MEKLKGQIRYFSQIFGVPVYLASHFCKRDPGLWVLGSTFGRRYADNPRFFYEYLSRMDDAEKEAAGLEPGKKIRAVWITHNPKLAAVLQKQGYEAYYYLSAEGRSCCRRAGVYLFDNYSKDISFYLSGGACKINLWHGTPLKKIQQDNRFDKVRNPENGWMRLYWMLRRMSDEKPSHYVLTTSDFFAPIFSSAFRTKHVLVCGYPRNDALLGTIQRTLLPGEKRKLCQLRQKLPARVLCYLPTFRESEKLFFEKTELAELMDYLGQSGSVLVIKLHPKSGLWREWKERLDALSEIQRKIAENRLILLEPDEDAYEFLRYADCLITDYSSVYFDYLLLDRPIVFYNYDYEEYLSQSRELYFPYEEFTPGKKAADGHQLIRALETMKWEKAAAIEKKRQTGGSPVNGYHVTDGYEQQRQQLRSYVYDQPDGRAGRRLVKQICMILEARK